LECPFLSTPHGCQKFPDRHVFILNKMRLPYAKPSHANRRAAWGLVNVFNIFSLIIHGDVVF
jgi:hypothetical protein